MRVSVLPGDTGGCGTYRCRMPAEAVKTVRPDWHVTVHAPRGDLHVGQDSAGRVVEVLGLPEDTDLLVMQRTGTPVLAGVVDWAQSQGIAVVIDFDDAMWCIARGNAAWQAWNSLKHPAGQHWRWCDHTAQRADLVTVTTPGLADHYGNHGRVAVIPNYVPEWSLSVPSWRRQYPETPTVGWAGYVATHPGDCAVAAPAVHEARRHGAKVRVVADARGAAREYGLKPLHVEGIASQDYGPDYFGAISTLDLMLVGLVDSRFNRCKSTLKVLEAAAAGVPSVAAVTHPHRLLQREGFPVLLAESPAEWRQHAATLLGDPARLTEHRNAVVETVKAYTIEAHAETWAQAWERAVARREGVAR